MFIIHFIRAVGGTALVEGGDRISIPFWLGGKGFLVNLSGYEARKMADFCSATGTFEVPFAVFLFKVSDLTTAGTILSSRIFHF